MEKSRFGRPANLWRRSGSLLAKCKLGVAVWRKVCGNKLLMCFLFVAGRSYRAAPADCLDCLGTPSSSTSRRVSVRRLCGHKFVPNSQFPTRFQFKFFQLQRGREGGKRGSESAVEQVKMVEAAGKK